jgi:putative NADPH-quinone reductase
MKVLTVYAHPDPRSFCHAVLEQFTAGLHEAGHGVKVVDLYAIKFDPVFRTRDMASYLHEEMPPDILDAMNLKLRVLDNVPGGPVGRRARRAGCATRARRRSPVSSASTRPRTPSAMAEGRRRRRAGGHRAGVLAIDDWGLRYPGVKQVEHIYFYGAAIADPAQIQQYLRDARQLGRDFAVPAAAPAVASTEGA